MGRTEEKFESFTKERQAYWDRYAQDLPKWDRYRNAYQARLREITSFLIPPGMRVLELGCGAGNLLGCTRASYAVGVDFSARLLAAARQRYPQGKWVEGDAHTIRLNESFDYIICSDLVNEVWDVDRIFRTARAHAHANTKLILNFHSNLWQGPRRLAEAAGIARQQALQNWLTPEDTANLLYLAGWETMRSWREILCPFSLPLTAPLLNRYAVKLWPVSHLGLTNFMIARPAPEGESLPEAKVSVIVAARNEEGNVPEIFNRVPSMGTGTELIFVEGNSSDDTWGAIEREIAKRPGVEARLYKQSGKGKGDAVRKGFAEATGEVLMILDADLTVPPEDLPRFYEAWRKGRAEFVNGVRLVYPMEEKAMRFFNLLGNKFFSWAFSWLLGQTLKDTLCGTKVLSKQAYEVIAANRSYFGDFDPFGDFDLLFGAAKYNLRIVDLPVRYEERVYGETNIQRWRHGVLLLKMVVFAMRRIKFV